MNSQSFVKCSIGKSFKVRIPSLFWPNNAFTPCERFKTEDIEVFQWK